jgi:hypothetical protein
VDDDYVIFAADGHLTVQLRKTGKVLFKYPSPVNPDDPTGAIAAVAFKFPTASYLQWKNEVDEHGQIRRFEPIRGEWLRRTKVTLRRFEDLGSLEGTWTDDDDGDLPPWDDGGHEDDGEDGEDEDDEDEDDEDDEDEDDDQHEDDEDDDQTHQDQQDNYAGSLWEEDSEIYDDDVLLWVDELADPGEVHNELSGERYDVLPPAPVNFFDCEELTGPMTMRWRR